jgi:hypothetical protein
MLNTPLEYHSLKSKMADSLMLAVKASTVDECSSPDLSNLNGKVNKTFACFVAEILAVNLLFDCWFNHSPQSSPAPYAYIPDVIYSDLTYNRDLIVSYCICHKIGTTGMFDYLCSFCIDSFYVHSSCMLFFPQVVINFIHSFYFHSICMLFFLQIVFINFVYIYFRFTQLKCFSFPQIVSFPKGKMSSGKPRNSHGLLHP